MISEAMGKILGMVLAYGVSALGLLLAYVNYRKRVVKADRVMTGTAWGVVGAVVLAVVLGVWAVSGLTERKAATPQPDDAGETVAEAVVEEAAPAVPPPPVRSAAEWSWVGIFVPLAIFAFSTWMTVALFRRFTTHHHHGPHGP
ncbi:MAG TPA: hypothetical protein VLV48_04500 [Thermoanaerobaculia bacterium]|nr:hypothetical protein [Thermoanaerobaculia bacterium]